jgi:hypothetical protein
VPLVALSWLYPRNSVAKIGAKANNYMLLEHDFPAYVSKGFAITMWEYFRVLHRSGADELVNLLPAMKTDLQVDSLLGQIRDRIRSAQLDSSLLSLLNEVRDKYFDGKKIRLRSSTNCEDLPRFNGAGLYLSEGLKPNDRSSVVREKILDVYASMWTRAAYDERSYYGIDHSKAGMGILINEAYEDEFANGVVLTIPDNGVIHVLVDAQSGDHLVTNPGSGEVPEELLFGKNSDAYQVRTHSSISDVFLSNDSLTNMLPELRKIVLAIHTLLTKNLVNEKDKYGVDIEFKIVKAETGYALRIKQARLLYAPLPVE